MVKRLVICPFCNRMFDANDQRLANLNATTRLVWAYAGHSFQHGEEIIGPSDLAVRCQLQGLNISVRMAYYHLSLLVGEDLVRRVPQNKYRKARHLYTGTIVEESRVSVSTINVTT